MKIAISQLSQIHGNDQHRLDNQITDTMKLAFDAVIEHIKLAGNQGCNLICFPQWFIGFGIVDNIPNSFTDRISELAKKYNMNVVTGTLRNYGMGMKSRQCSVLINNKGEFLGCQEKRNLYTMEAQWFLNDEKINVFDTNMGRIVISHGDDCITKDVYEEVKTLKPNIWVLQTNNLINIDKYLGRQDTFETIVKERVEELGCIACVPMMLGEFMHVDYKGGSYVVDRKLTTYEIQDEDNLLICTVESN